MVYLPNEMFSLEYMTGSVNEVLKSENTLHMAGHCGSILEIKTWNYLCLLLWNRPDGLKLGSDQDHSTSNE